MKTKTDKPKTKSKDEEQFYQFAKALIAVSKKELDKELAKDERKKKSKAIKTR
ncbi:MAG TPA: hypothetical protein VGQ41_20560 [Pyrinomonadaceae bacterium]|jgi:hypothetical protein|nr:hypothetical protein [Pyrinomonadaceae bacterium]